MHLNLSASCELGPGFIFMAVPVAGSDISPPVFVVYSIEGKLFYLFSQCVIIMVVCADLTLHGPGFTQTDHGRIFNPLCSLTAKT
ncbi:hypothetical protein EAH77_08795 [Ewingella americana]|uniref:Uncharacterized protein n=1 Tax=Ewingella americana TaxID=41202 RepID=A0A502GM65_9GAMM|nr:hypothetical protein EAH77_08795 [Ewingella americana]